ncbi:M20 family metallopeptidase (plasmid) [Halorientalis pallida]|uniref:M20 family metallopeptidase n=1 Tax=Halorientalis pallida TaxID=2479928 RepID=UPI003C7042A6
MSEADDPLDTVTEYISKTEAELMQTTERLVQADTQNPPGCTRTLAEWLIDEFTALGYEHEVFCIDPEKPNVVVTIPGDSAYTLLFNGHLDTVPFQADDWSHDPLGERIDDRLYGRGATDMKGAIGAMVQVARAYANTNTTPPITLQFAFVSDEEVAGDAGLTTRLKCDRLDPDACVIGEATGRPGVNSIAVGDRGYVWPTIEAEGIAAHGSRPMFGTNAVDRLYRALEACRTHLQQLDAPLESLDETVIDESIEYYAHQLDRETARDLFSAPTVNLGTFKGGETVNSVPANASAKLDVRILPPVDPEAIVRTIRNCLGDRPGTNVSDISWTAGTYTDPETALVRAATNVAEEVMPTPVYRRLATGSGDAQAFRENDIPTIEFATGTGTVHASDEYTTADKLLQNAQAYATLPFELARLDDADSVQ